MYRVCQKLKFLKPVLKQLNKNGFGDVHVEDANSFASLLEAQEKMHKNPHDTNIINAEKEAAKMYKRAHKNFVEFMRQKTQQDWIVAEDENSRLFHQSLKKRRMQNSIFVIKDRHGEWRDNPKEVKYVFWIII